MRTITLEEHFITESFVKATGAPRFAALQPKLLDLGASRIADMDEAGIDLQVLARLHGLRCARCSDSHSAGP